MKRLLELFLTVPMAEPFFSSLKKERIKETTYKIRGEARSEVVDYTGLLYNQRCRYSHLGHVSPVDYE